MVYAKTFIYTYMSDANETATGSFRCYSFFFFFFKYIISSECSFYSEACRFLTVH